jgi:hypothetical protein
LPAEKPEDEKFIGALGKCKDAIGEWHDWKQLVRIAIKILKDEKNSKFLHALNATVAKKYQAALAVTNKMRDHFILRKKGKRANTKGCDRTDHLRIASHREPMQRPAI